jgi:hypothetical protein
MFRGFTEILKRLLDYLDPALVSVFKSWRRAFVSNLNPHSWAIRIQQILRGIAVGRRRKVRSIALYQNLGGQLCCFGSSLRGQSLHNSEDSDDEGGGDRREVYPHRE